MLDPWGDGRYDSDSRHGSPALMTPPPHASRHAIWAALAVVALGLAVQLPIADRPFGVHEVNPGNFFGVWARNWERFGLWESRGLPLGSQLLDQVHQGDPDTNHPPLYGWLSYWCGTSEAALRVPTIAGHALSAGLMVLLLAGALGVGPATLAGVTTLAVPALAFYSQVSFECVVLPVGLALWLACLAWCRAAPAARRRWAALVAALAFVNVWLDWLAVFLTFGTLPLLWTRPWRTAIARLAVPFGATLLAGITVFAWRSWALALPTLTEGTGAPGHHSGEGLGALIERTFLTRPPLGEFIALVWAQLQSGYAMPLLVAGAVGLVPLARRAPRVLGAAALSAVVIPLLFAGHASTHVHFVSYFAPLLAAGLAALVRVHRALWLVGLTILGVTAWSSAHHIRAADTTLFRELGATLSRAARDAAGRRSIVFFNIVYRYGYYVDSPDVQIQPLTDPAPLRLADQLPPELGLRYLYLKMSGPLLDAIPALAPRPELEAYLAPFPRERMPALEMAITVPPQDLTMRVDEAWLYKLVP
ncbi:MAG: hypothetical protein AAF628_02685 [Planctomycetota bacterium]